MFTRPRTIHKLPFTAAALLNMHSAAAAFHRRRQSRTANERRHSSASSTVAHTLSPRGRERSLESTRFSPTTPLQAQRAAWAAPSEMGSDERSHIHSRRVLAERHHVSRRHYDCSFMRTNGVCQLLRSVPPRLFTRLPCRAQIARHMAWGNTVGECVFHAHTNRTCLLSLPRSKTMHAKMVVRAAHSAATHCTVT